ncbi:hypothetical protein BH10ACI2_BH10ACI2_13820 [soil metagenome]
MNPDQIKEFYDTYFYYIILAGVVFGLLIGAVPLILGIKKKKRNLGLIAIALCALTGSLSPLLCLIVAAVFTIVIIMKPRETVSSEPKEESSTEFIN